MVSAKMGNVFKGSILKLIVCNFKWLNKINNILIIVDTFAGKRQSTNLSHLLNFTDENIYFRTILEHLLNFVVHNQKPLKSGALVEEYKFYK